MIFSKGSGINDSVFGKSQEPIVMFAEKMEEAFEKKNVIPFIFKMDDIDLFAGKYSSLTSMRDFDPVGEGGQGPEADIQVGYEKVIEPETWKLKFALTQEMVEDRTLLRNAKIEMAKMIQSHDRTKQKFAASIFKNSTSSTMTFNGQVFNIAGADNQPFFSTAHPSITGNFSNQSNLFNAVFSYDNLSRVEELHQDFRDDNGELLNLAPDTILIPNDNRAAQIVIEQLGGDYRPGTADNDASFHVDRWRIIKWPYLNRTSLSGQTANTFAWWVFDSAFNEMFDGLVFQNRMPLRIRSYIEDNTDNNVFQARSRWTAAPNNWRAFSGCVPGVGTAIN